MRIEAVLRPARSQDMAACAAILNDWIDETEWMPRVHSHGDVVRHYQQDVFTKKKVFVVTAGSRIAGMMAIDVPDAMVTALYVGGAFRGQGIGRKLIERAKAEMGARVLLYTFQANSAALDFYAKQGFVKVNSTDGDNEEGLPDVLLEWRHDG